MMIKELENQIKKLIEQMALLNQLITELLETIK